MTQTLKCWCRCWKKRERWARFHRHWYQDCGPPPWKGQRSDDRRRYPMLDLFMEQCSALNRRRWRR